ncbi:TonB-dependent receptor [Novosphingobium sp.]|uniref:TonB-dependent receptor n=1 Tax=Novosphingobium sp. TaxID=1874826 RepID=UPI003B5304A7
MKRFMAATCALYAAASATSAFAQQAALPSDGTSGNRPTSTQSKPHPDNLTDSIMVTGRRADLTGVADSANQGEVSAADIALRPLLRPGEVVEQIPGVIITQHSGSGKANQYFLRGFNLDHGTDLAVSVDGVPVNMPSHAHGQGYADLNFLIPELVEKIDYKKGPYYADVGDFGSAGAFDLHYYDRLPHGIAQIEGGQYGYGRALIANSQAIGADNLLYAIEVEHNDGPWVKGDNERKIDGLLRYASGTAANGWSITASAYHNIWNSTDQVPDRAIAGLADPVGAPTPPAPDLISRYGEIDGSDGGNTGRYALTAAWRHTGQASSTHASAYVLHYDLNLFSNFSYFLDDPVHGDQIEQQDQRWIIGGHLDQNWHHTLLGRPSDTTLGLDVRSDIINNGLYHTEDRIRLSATTVNHIVETSVAPYVQNQTHWTDWLRTIVGLRADAFWMNVDNKAGGNSGNANRQIFSPKVNVVFGPWEKTELYLDYGRGFHSNDARGVTSNLDPATALPRSSGEEIGLRTTRIPHLRSELSLWRLHLQSELVWDGDAGTNTPSGPTTRYGVEFANWYTPTKWLTIDADYAWSHARFTDVEPDGNYVPEALVSTFDGGIALHDLPGRVSRFSAGLRLRYFGPRPLTQDGTVKSKATTLLYADFGYRISDHARLGVNVFNLLDNKSSDIDYYYVSRLPGEPVAGVADIHTHPSEPREIRASFTLGF